MTDKQKTAAEWALEVEYAPDPDAGFSFIDEESMEKIIAAAMSQAYAQGQRDMVPKLKKVQRLIDVYTELADWLELESDAAAAVFDRNFGSKLGNIQTANAVEAWNIIEAMIADIRALPMIERVEAQS